MPVLANPRHELFAQQVAKGLPATQAWLKISPSTTVTAARVTASRTLANANVLARVEELKLEMQQAVLASTTITAAMILSRAWQIASSDDRDRVPALNVAARFFPEYHSQNVVVDAGTTEQHLHLPPGLTVAELQQLARGD